MLGKQARDGIQYKHILWSQYSGRSSLHFNTMHCFTNNSKGTKMFIFLKLNDMLYKIILNI